MEFEKRRNKLLPVNFFWWRAAFHKVFIEAKEEVPSDGKIHGAIRRADITLQSVRDHKSKSVAERIDQVRRQLIRLDRVQQSTGLNRRDPTCGRFGRGDVFAFDEHSAVMFPKTKKTFNHKGSASCHSRVPNNLDTRQMSGCPIFCFGHEQLPKVAVVLPLAPSVSERDINEKPVAWDVTIPSSPKIKKEMKT